MGKSRGRWLSTCATPMVFTAKTRAMTAGSMAASCFSGRATLGGEDTDGDEDGVERPLERAHHARHAGGVGHVQPVVASRERGDIATPRAHFIRHGTADAARGPYDKCIHHVRRSYRAAAIGQSP